MGDLLWLLLYMAPGLALVLVKHRRPVADTIARVIGVAFVLAVAGLMWPLWVLAFVNDRVTGGVPVIGYARDGDTVVVNLSRLVMWRGPIGPAPAVDPLWVRDGWSIGWATWGFRPSEHPHWSEVRRG